MNIGKKVVLGAMMSMASMPRGWGATAPDQIGLTSEEMAKREEERKKHRGKVESENERKKIDRARRKRKRRVDRGKT